MAHNHTVVFKSSVRGQVGSSALAQKIVCFDPVCDQIGSSALASKIVRFSSKDRPLRP